MKIANSVRSMTNQDGGILLDIDQGLMFSLNIVGSKIIDKLQRGMEPSQIVDEISAEFGAPREMIQKDVEEFLACLQEKALLQTNGNKRK